MLPVLISVTCTQDLDHFGVKTSSRSQHHTETYTPLSTEPRAARVPC